MMNLSPWCNDYIAAVDSGDFTAMQQIITTVASTFGLTWQQAGQLLNDECLCPDNNNTGPCPPSDQNSPFYTNAGEFCGQCQPGGYYHSINHPDCRCCDDNSGTGCVDPMGLTYNASVNPGQLNLSAGVSGGTGPYTYSWVNTMNPGVVIYTGQDLPLSPLGVNLPDGNYTGTVTDANGCTSSNTVTIINGCIDPTAQNYNPAANLDDGSCMNNPLPIAGCMNPMLGGYNPSATVDCSGNPLPLNGGYGDQNCCGMPPPPPISGCTDPTAQNYNPAATVDDGSCIASVYGCTNPTALNYYAGAQVDDGSCCFVAGCTDPTQSNYNPQACIDDGSCIPYTYGCTNPQAINYNPSVSFDDGSCIFPNQIGCTDPMATNYSPTAIIDDGSCTYGARGGSSSFNGFTNI